MAPTLRFHDAPTPTSTHAPTGDGSRVVIPFPGALAAARERLVAARVSGNVFDDVSLLPDGVLARPFARKDDTQTSDMLIRDIESTLDRMQNRLDRFKRQVDECFKFPAQPPEDTGPRAA